MGLFLSYWEKDHDTDRPLVLQFPLGVDIVLISSWDIRTNAPKGRWITHIQNGPCYFSRLFKARRNSAVLHYRYYDSNQQFKTLSIIVSPKGFVYLFTGIELWLLSALNDIQHSFCSSVCFQILGDVLVRMFSRQFHSQQFQSTRSVCDQLITTCNQNFS